MNTASAGRLSLDFGATPEQWHSRRKELYAQWMRILGPFPPRGELKPSVVSEEVLPAFIRRKVRYRVEHSNGDVWTQAYLLIPRPAPKHGPAAVVFHSTTEETIREPAGLGGPASLHTAVHLVERGYTVLCPGNFLWEQRDDSIMKIDGERDRYLETSRRFLAKHPGWTGMGKMVWDGMRAVDFLETLDAVNPARIGCFGFSLGGKEALYAAAFDQRIRAAVSTEGGIGLSCSNWHDPWYLGPQVRMPGFARDHHEVLALVAPRAFLLMGGAAGVGEEDNQFTQGADGERSRPYIDCVRPLYQRMEAPSKIDILCHAHGHSVPAVAREAAYAWLDRFLKDP